MKMKVQKRDGRLQDLSLDKIKYRIKQLCYELTIDYDIIVLRVVKSLYDGITTIEIDEESARIAINILEHPDFSILASRIIVSNMHKNTKKSFVGTMKLINESNPDLLSDEYMKLVEKHGSKLQDFLCFQNDYKFDYFGFKTLEKSYLLRSNGKIAERPQHLYMRIALALFKDDLDNVKMTYRYLSEHLYTHATPTMFNAGTNLGSLSSCFLLGTKDSIEGIFETMSDCAQISKLSGGIGIHVSNIRAKGSKIRGTNGTSDGIVPMLKVYNAIVNYVDQGGGKRKGSIAIYLETFHADIFAFLDLRKNQGDENVRARDLFYAMYISDYFMECVENDSDWYLMCPDESKGLTEVYGDKFKELYTNYVSQGLYREKIKARDLWNKIIKAQIETGVPYITYKDHVNHKNNQKNIGVIKSSNLCVAPETMILTDKGYYPINSLERQTINVWNGKKFSSTTVFKTGKDKELLTVKLSNGTKIECTEYHKFYIKSNEIITVEAKELEEGMKLVQCKYPIVKESFRIFNKALLYYKSLDERLKLLEARLQYIDTVFCIENQNKQLVLYFLYVLQSLGCNGSIKYDAKLCGYKLIISEFYIKQLVNLGLKLKSDIQLSEELVLLEELEEVTVEQVVKTGRISDTYCFTEPLENAGVFNGNLTGQCNEINIVSNNLEYGVCFTADTQILTKQGYKRIDECDNQEVLSYFDNDMNFNEKQQFVNAKLIDNGIKDVYELECNGMKSIKATENHLFAVLQGRSWCKTNTYKWVQLKDLTPNDKIIVPKTIILPKYDINDILQAHNEDYLTIGWMIGDGWQSKTSEMKRSVYGVCFGPNDTFAREKVINTLVKWYDNTELQKYGYHTKTESFYTDRNGVYSWASSKQNFIQYIKETYGLYEKLAPLKCIPDIIKKSEPIMIASCLSGLFSADGSVYLRYKPNCKENRFYVSLSSSSKTLLCDVQQMLKCFAIESRIVFSSVKGRKNKQGRVTIQMKDSLLNFKKYVNFVLSKEKQEQLECGLNIFKKRNIFREYTKLKSIKYIGKEQVYDLNVPNTHNFIAEGFVVHNCNLASIALPRFVDQKEKKYNFQELLKVAKFTVVSMNKVIDCNYYSLEKSRKTDEQNRPLGIGIQGLMDVYFMLDLPFNSPEAIKLNKQIFETIYYGVVTSSIELAKVDGSYASFEGSPFSKGQLQFDLWKEFSGINLDDYLTMGYPWDTVKEDIQKYGIRNSLITALMPTCSSSILLGNFESFENPVSCCYKRSTLSGEYIVINKYLVKKLLELNLWNEQLKQKIILHDGSIQNIPEIPNNIKEIYKTVWETSQKDVLNQCRDRGVFVDQAISMNVYLEKPTLSKISSMLMYGWKIGLKTGCYYLRSRSVSSAAKVTVDASIENAQNNNETNDAPACSIDNPDCQSCSA